MRLDANDIEQALADSFDFSIYINADTSIDAKITYDYSDANAPATLNIKNVYTAPTKVDCSVDIERFCLNNIESAGSSSSPNMHKFTFDLEVNFNP